MIVIDNSVVLAWCLADEINAYADAVMEVVLQEGAVAPWIWWYEVRNSLVVNERRGRLESADTEAILADLGGMGILLDRDHVGGEVVRLAREHQTTAYDAAYLELESAGRWDH